MVLHQLHVPSAPVGLFVENMWLVRGHLTEAARYLLLPDGAILVIFNLGEPQMLCQRSDVSVQTVCRASWVSGQQTQPVVIQQAGDLGIVGVRFRPGGAHALFGIPMLELTGRVVELDDIWGSDAGRVRQQLAEASTARQLLRNLEHWLARRLRGQSAPDRRIGFAAAALEYGGCRIARIADQANCSHRHLIQEFTEKMGLTPKQYGRIRRLQRTISAVGQQPTARWSDVAVTHGFYDQAHLIREFVDLSGVTPAGYLARRSPYLGYLNVA